MPTDSAYKIRGTKVTSPYPVELTPAEHRLVFSLQKVFSPENIFADCYFPKVDFRHRQTYDPHMANFDLAALRNLPGSEVVQIDCLALSAAGVFVFESKDYHGWIYGDGHQRFWTQTLNYGQEKHQFYNPVRQNATHIAALADIFSPDLPIYSVIVFGGEAVLKSVHDLPARTYVTTQPALRNLLSRLTLSAASPAVDLARLRADLTAARLLPNRSMRAQHISDLQAAAPKA